MLYTHADLHFQIYRNISQNNLRDDVLSLVGVLCGSTTLALNSSRSAEDREEAMLARPIAQADVIYLCTV